MKFIPIEASSAAITADHILVMCQRAFGSAVQVVSARELSGGTFNKTFLITFPDQEVILRIAPPPTVDLFWHEQQLMRREQHIQPFFASLAHLMPRTLMADFTHQIMARDYIFQTFIAGERWDEIAESITLEEQLQLWEQFGRITKTIHSTVGTAFGGPYPLAEFPTWSQTIIDRLERVVRAMTEAQLDVTDIRSVLAIVQNQPTILDTIRQPHLLHGDLWLFNILIKRSSAGSNIVGILDADRAWWGDPLADWTMFVLEKSTSPDTQRFHDCFWQGYGQVDQTPNIAFRKTIYEAMHVGTALAWAVRVHDDDTVERGRHDLSVAATNLSNLLS